MSHAADSLFEFAMLSANLSCRFMVAPLYGPQGRISRANPKPPAVALLETPSMRAPLGPDVGGNELKLRGSRFRRLDNAAKRPYPWFTVRGVAMPESISQIIPSVAPSPTVSTLDLRMMPLQQVLDLYHRLDAPPFEEMHGEFAASLLDQGSAGAYLFGAFAVNFKGRWLCKAFEPTGPNEGHGYNTFQDRRGVQRAARMRTRIGPSKLPGDEKDAFHLEYADFNSLRKGGPTGAYMHTMFDEVRKVADRLYLGIGRLGFTEKAQAHLRPFILEGPVAEFVGAD